MLGKSSRDNSVASLISTRTGDTQPSTLATGRTATTVRRSSRGSSNMVSKPTNTKRGRDLGRQGNEETDVQDFDLGNFFNFAEWYGDDPYMTMALALFEKAPPGTVLRSPTMLQVISRRFMEVREADPETMDERDKLVTNRVVFTLPNVIAEGVLGWDKVSYKLPTERDRKDRDMRIVLLKFLDGTNTGKITVEDLKLGCARIVSMPGVEDPENILDEVIRRSQKAVQELMLDGLPRQDDDILVKEFRIFLMFLQGYMDLWEIFFEVDDSGDEWIKLAEFCKCAQTLKDWGVKDPNLIKNPASVFAQIDIDQSGSVSFGEFADFCIRRGLMEEVAKDLRNV